MKTPPTKMTWNALSDWVQSELGKNYKEHEEPGKPETYVVRCKTCGDECRMQIFSPAIHDNPFDRDLCMGTGKVRSFGVPYCPTCERDAPKFVRFCTHG